MREQALREVHALTNPQAAPASGAGGVLPPGATRRGLARRTRSQLLRWRAFQTIPNPAAVAAGVVVGALVVGLAVGLLVGLALTASRHDDGGEA